jgi:hypothetical protein
MDRKQLQKTLKRILPYGLTYLATILAFGLLAIYPHQKSIAGLRMEIKETRRQLKQQKILFPLYSKLVDKEKRNQPMVPSMPERTQLESRNMDRLPFIFEEIAEKNNLELVSVVPDVKSPADVQGLWSVDARLTGEFSDFRGFLICLGQIANLTHLETMRIRSVEGVPEFRIKAWLALNE